MNPKDTYERLITALRLEIPSFIEFSKLVQLSGKDSVFMAGGAVRDAFLEDYHHVKDLDVFLTAEAFNRIREYLIQNGDLQVNQFGTYRWYANLDQGFYYDIIVLSDFYNGLWQCRNIIDVLNQFDITINALAFDLYNGTFYNPQNGLLDISQRLLKAVRFDFPEIPVSEQIALSRNTVLWFRYSHYAQKLNLEIDGLTALWIEKNSFRKNSIEEFALHFFNPLLT